MIYEKIISISRTIRQKCFDFAMSKDSVDNCFHENETLECMCAFVSFVLYTVAMWSFLCELIQTHRLFR